MSKFENFNGTCFLTDHTNGYNCFFLSIKKIHLSSFSLIFATDNSNILVF